MKILAIHGSMRKGKTYALTKEILDRLSVKPDVEIIEINVAGLDLPFCRSCHTCFSKGEEYCPDYKIMRQVQTALTECDGIILSGTTYMWALNASMKNLLDHLSYGFHRPALFGKKGMVIATSKGNGEKGVTKYMKTVLGQWGVNGAIIVTQNEKEQQLKPPEKITKQLDRSTGKFYKQIVSKRFIKPSLKSIAVHNAFRAMALSDFAEFKRDTEFWSQKEMNKAYPVKAGAFKRMTGGMVYGLAKFLTKIIGRKYLKKLKIETGDK